MLGFGDRTQKAILVANGITPAGRRFSLRPTLSELEFVGKQEPWICCKRLRLPSIRRGRAKYCSVLVDSVLMTSDGNPIWSPKGGLGLHVFRFKSSASLSLLVHVLATTIGNSGQVKTIDNSKSPTIYDIAAEYSS